MPYYLTVWIDSYLLFPFFTVLLCWSVWRYVRTFHALKPDWRNRFGAIGLLLGLGSALPYYSFFFIAWTTGHLIAHGSVLLILYYTGECAALVGLAFSLLGRGWLRYSAVVVNTILTFFWFRLMTTELTAAALISTGLYMCLIAIAAVWSVASIWPGRSHRAIPGE